ncbi:MAG: hypothetical protein EBY17_04625 [Acidobacteriia bacterium]|jgi:uncharacterized SAM-dependent methyltransferase|nr:hypothetical protein [Terriglobia bacterium]
MNIEVLLTEAEIAQEFADSLEARDLPEKFFYWTPLSVKRWKELSERSEGSLRATWESLAAKAAGLTAPFGAKVPVISLGAGEGLKDRLFLRALVAAGRDVKYFPVDASQTLLEMAVAGAEDDDVEVLGIKADIASHMHLVLAADVSEAPRIFLMVGNTLGGFDPMDQIKQVADVVQKGDILIIDARLRDGAALPPREEQRRFVFAPLEAAGVTPDDGQVDFAENRDDRLDGLYMVTRRFQAARDLRFQAGGKEVPMARGERILLNFRYMYTAEAFRWLLTEHAGLRVVGEMNSPDGRFITAVCIRA